MSDPNERCCSTVAIVFALLALLAVNHIEDRLNQTIRYTETVAQRVDRIEAAHGLSSRSLRESFENSKEALAAGLAPCLKEPHAQTRTFVDCLARAMERNAPVTGE